jgi:hypothetical protein
MKPLTRSIAMKNKLSSTSQKVKGHVVRNRAKYAYVAGFITASTMHYKIDRVSQWNAFLEEKGLTSEFYNPEDHF